MKKSNRDDFERTAVRVSNVSIIGNSALSLFKLIAGIVAGSGAMISDAIHSASDVFSSIIVIIGVKSSRKASDAEHPYGHERFESVAAIVLAMILCITGLFIGHTAIEKLSAGVETINKPGVLALQAAVVSIVCKEAMYWYTRRSAKRIESSALMAEAWHHRSDALSSVGALVGIFGARRGALWLDPAASLIICLFILKAAYDIFREAIDKLVDRSCSEEMQGEIIDCAKTQDGVLGVGKLKTRQFGNRVYVDLEIFADGDISLTEGAEVSERVHKAIEERFPKIKHISVRVSPY